ncbi:hypothetical protein [Embleya sp. AB8]|uniref:hypothetical protein n=1 Tax=Embleya sp. AB8 TaxID=3156304 RepID=UPI003C773515
MTELIARFIAWAFGLPTPPKSTGKHACPAEPKRPRPSRPTNPKPQVRPQWRSFHAADITIDADPADAVRPYVTRHFEALEKQRADSEAEYARQQARARLAELADATTRPARDWTVAARAAGVMA